MKKSLQHITADPDSHIKEPSVSPQKVFAKILFSVAFAVIISVGLVYVPAWILFKIDIYYGTNIISPAAVKYLAILLVASLISTFVAWRRKKMTVFFILLGISLLGYLCFFDIIFNWTENYDAYGNIE
jgi:uncharacterized membrane protein